MNRVRGPYASENDFSSLFAPNLDTVTIEMRGKVSPPFGEFVISVHNIGGVNKKKRAPEFRGIR